MKKLKYRLSYLMFIPFVIEVIIRFCIVSPIIWLLQGGGNAMKSNWSFDIMVSIHEDYEQDQKFKKLKAEVKKCEQQGEGKLTIITDEVEIKVINPYNKFKVTA